MAHSATWDETAPPGVSTPAATLDTIIQNMKRDIRERARLEHNYNGSLAPGTTYDGEHLEGSARALIGLLSTRPVNHSTAEVVGAGGNEEGRLFVASDGGYVNPWQVSDGTIWQRVFGIKIAALTTVNTVKGTTTTTFPAFNGGTNQNYAQASFDFTGRSGVSNCLLLAWLTITTPVISVTMRLARDSNANIEGPTLTLPMPGTSSGITGIIAANNVAMSAAAHILDLQFAAGGAAPTTNGISGGIIVLDLGVT